MYVYAYICIRWLSMAGNGHHPLGLCHNWCTLVHQVHTGTICRTDGQTEVGTVYQHGIGPTQPCDLYCIDKQHGKKTQRKQNCVDPKMVELGQLFTFNHFLFFSIIIELLRINLAASNLHRCLDLTCANPFMLLSVMGHGGISLKLLCAYANYATKRNTLL